MQPEIVRNCGGLPAALYGVELGLLIEALKAVSPDTVVSYDNLSKAAKLDVLEHRHLLQTAMRRLLKESQLRFEAVRGVGVRRLVSEQIVGAAHSDIRKIGRAARRSQQKLAAAEYTDLTDQGKLKYSVGMTVLSLIRHGATDKTSKRIEAGMTASIPKQIAVADTLALLAK